MSILVIAEHHHEILKPSTLTTISAATMIGTGVSVLVAGNNCQKIADQISHIAGVETVLLASHEYYAHQLSENIAELIREQAERFTHILAPATTFGKNLLPRVAALLDVAQISDVIQILSPDTFVRPIYAGNALATVRSQDPIKVLTIRTTAFPRAAVTENTAAMQSLSTICENRLSSFVKEENTPSVRPDLGNASIVVSGGRGLQNGDNFKLVEQLADILGAAVGASRAAVDAGFVPNEYQVGQTGRVVAPDLYIAIGISGAIQHLAGMKDSKVIVAINKDPDAPIFQMADYGLVGDLFEIVPALISALGHVKAS